MFPEKPVFNRKLKIGFIVNPLAGMGGRVGLKGTDGVLKEALALGAKPVSPTRAISFLKKLRERLSQASINIITCPGEMGLNEIVSAGLEAEVLPLPDKAKTTAEDTKLAVKMMADLDVDLIIFVGGDGTARDVLDALKARKDILVLGIPSGVKMYSGVFSVSPIEAVEVILAFMRGDVEVTDLEVMDVDEEAFRRDQLSIKLYGYVKGPYLPLKIQPSKQATPETADERENQLAIARYIVENMNPQATYILCPGTTVKCIADLLGVEKTLLGVDIYRDRMIIKDVNEEKILRKVKDFGNTWIIVSPIGRQGIIFGRGNQQVSPEIIKKVGKEKIIVVATRRKLQSIVGRSLRVDTGDWEVDEYLRGYVKTIVDYGVWRIVRII